MLPSRSYLAFCLFLSTLSLRRATAGNGGSGSITAISIHALLAESDALTSGSPLIVSAISIHALLAESDAPADATPLWYLGISIHALLAESDIMQRPAQRLRLISIHALLAESDVRARAAEGQRPEISIHALLAESDTPAGKVRPWASHISIHALLAESDVLPSYYTSRDYIFLSTLSLRRATGNPARRPIGRRHFYPRSPCGERLKLFAKRLGNALISIHALLAESDLLWRRPKLKTSISIHALLAESDR